MKTRPSIRAKVLTAAAIAALLPLETAIADGTFDGGQVSMFQVRDWMFAGPNPAINWGFDIAPVPGVDAITFTNNGDGVVMLGGMIHSQPTVTFNNWTSYGLFGGTLDMMAPGGSTITVNQSVGDTYGSAYFSDGHNIGAALTFTTPTTIDFTGLTTGALMLSGMITPGSAPLTLTRSPAGATGTRGVYFATPNPGYASPVTINTGTAARILGGSRTGAGVVNLQGGDFDILSEPAQAVGNPISSVSGTVRADHNFTFGPLPVYAPGTLHTIGPVTVDNPLVLGATTAASIRFTANNGYNFSSPMLMLANTAGFIAPTRTVTVDNGQLTAGWAGSIRATSANRLQEQVVTASFTTPAGVAPVLFDGGLTLTKAGTGVLVLNGDNQVSSTGPKVVTGGVLRYGTAFSRGTTTGLPLGPLQSTTLAGGPGPVSAGMGIGYPTTPAGGGLILTGTIPGQSGAWDVDFLGNPAPVALTYPGGAGLTALRLGSSGVGSQVGAIGFYFAPATGTSTYYFGGGGGVLTLPPGPALGIGPGPGPTVVEMGTTGTLLPGTVNVMRALPIGSMVNIRAGTLQAFPPAVWGPVGVTSLGAYSTAINTGAEYAAAPVATPFNGPGQLLLDDATHIGGGYFYGPFGTFGGPGLLLDGGAVGWDGAVPLFALPGVYGAPMPSTLYQSAAVPLVPMGANILHLGGENSAGVMTVAPAFPITNNFATGTPVALIKSGSFSTLDLTFGGPNPYTGGTGIMGGEIMVNMAPQLGTGAITIADGASLHVTPGMAGPVIFPQILRVSNGVDRRSSIINVDGPVTAQFTGATSPTLTALEANAIGSILEKQGMGELNLFSTALTPLATGSPTSAWGLKATMGTVAINHLPGIFTASNGQVLLDGGVVKLASPFEPGVGIPIGPGTQFSPNYGLSAMTSYAGTASVISVGGSAFFRLTGAQAGAWMGDATVDLGPLSVFKISGNALGSHTRGTGTVSFNGMGVVQFTPGAGNALLPRDGGFTLALNGVAFAGCPDANINGNLLFNNLSPIGAGVSFIDAATVSNVPAVAASTWTIAGTGLTNWNGTVVKGSTQAMPGGVGPFTSGVVTINRTLGAPVVVNPLALLQIDTGVVNAGANGDPFTDTITGLSVNVTNNSDGPGVGAPVARGFNITAGSKAVGDLTVTGFAPAAPAVPSGATSVYPGASLTANHVRQNRLDVNAGATVTIRTNGTSGGTSYIANLAIAGGVAPTATMDLDDNDMIVTGATPLATVRAQIRNARNLGAWNMPGITSSAARNNAMGTTGLGLISGAEYLAIYGGGATFDTIAVAAGNSVIKYTWNGDSDLSGVVDGADYARIDAAYNMQVGAGAIGGWVNGDSDYNDTIDGADYALIDAAFNSQVGTMSPAMSLLGLGGGDPNADMNAPSLTMVRQHLAQFGQAYANAFLSSVPEPTAALGVAFAIGAAQLRRPATRRRRRSINPAAPASRLTELGSGTV